MPSKRQLECFNDKGESKYSEDYAGVWSTTDVYKITLEYLLKKKPVYTK